MDGNNNMLQCKTVKDGVIDHDTYSNRKETPVRVLFLMKEANDPNGGDWDLCEFISKGARWQTWNNAARWAIALGATSNAYNDDVYINEDIRKAVLSHVAVVNLKKVPGGSTSNTEEIRCAAKDNAALLKQQITECAPDVIVCCGSGVADGLGYVFEDSDLHWVDFQGHRYCIYGNTVVLDFWHPASRKNKSVMVDDIVQLYQTARQVR